MARVAIVSYDVQTIRGKSSGVGAFVTRWAKLLRDAGEDVTIIMTRCDWEPMSVDPQWRVRYQEWGISLMELQSPPPLPTRWPEVPTMRIAEIAAPVLRNFDIVYLQDWGNPGFHLLRERRYDADQGPVCVTVLHGPSEWELSSNAQYPELPGDLHLAYQERYAARHSDFVVSPSRYMAEYLGGLGWEFPGEVTVLGLPMTAPVDSGDAVVPPKLAKIVYFGRIEERKGIRLFVRALELLAKDMTTQPEVVLLGSAKDAKLEAFAMRGLKQAGYRVTHIADMDSVGAMKYLHDHATETLCVAPSPCDNHPYSIVEASLVPGLNLIVCRGGGVPEILNGAEAQLAEPFPRELAAKIAECLKAPLSTAQLAHYDWRAANGRWLAFHQMALTAKNARAGSEMPASKPSVDVCTTYFQKAAYLGQFVEALEHQTEQDFHVIAVNDGSPDAESNRVFHENAERTKARGWEFFSQENAFVDAARNNAAARGKGDLILFVDSDDVPARNAVARMREAMVRSGDDALICASYLFASGQAPFDLETGEATVPAYATCIPLGMDLVGGIVNPAAFGGSMFMVRRSAFEAIGGFTEMRGAGHEDWELYVRLTLAGYKVDVLPELLQFYRQVEGGLARTLPSENSRRRLLRAYEKQMTAAGLEGGALALAGLYESGKAMQVHIKNLEAKTDAPTKGYSFFSGASRSFSPERDSSVGRLQYWYRKSFRLETRLKIHRILLSRFVGPYEPPSA
jgi:GT2 family glycosyltransferase/glycosyltransferase involved in cell wall biosynthesis